MASEGSRGRCLDREGATGYAPDLPPLQEGVEDTSVPRHEAQLAVEWKLNQRPQKQELIARNILTSIPASPALQSQAMKLQWEKKSNQLEQKIRRRPQLNDVVNLNILKDPKLAPGIQAAQDQLRRKNLAENLNQRIALRPGPLELIKEGILDPGDESIVRALKSIPLSKASDVNEVSRSPEVDPSPPPEVSASAISRIIRRKSVQEASRAGTLTTSGHYMTKRHSIGGSPNMDTVFQSPPPASQLSMSMSLEDTSNMEWESNTDKTKERPSTRKASESSIGSLPSPIDFSCLQADSPVLKSPENAPVSSSSPSALSNFSTPFSASVLCKKRGGVMSPRPQRKKSSSKNSKVRKYNFHEYKPPNHHGKIEKKPSTTTKPSGPYDYIVQQQQILLQIQLLQQQYPEQLSQIASSGNKDQQMTAIMKALGELSQQGGNHVKKGDKSGRGTPKMDMHKSSHTGSSVNSSSQLSPESLISCENGQKIKLEDIKVNHLRSACKERGLGVTGKKSELLERLLEQNNGQLPSSVVAEVMMERRQSLTTTSNPVGGPSAPVNGSQPKPQRSDPTSTPAKQKLQAEQLQEKIKEICEQSKRVHLSGKSGTLYPAPVVEAMYNFDIHTPVSSTTSTHVPHGPAASSHDMSAVGSQNNSPYTGIRANSSTLSPDVGKRPSEDFLQIITSQSSPSFHRSPTPNPSSDPPSSHEVLSPTQDLLEQLKLSGSVSWSPDTITPAPEGLMSLSNGSHPGKFSEPTPGVGMSQSNLQVSSGLVRDTPLLTSTASQPFHDQLLSTTTKSEAMYGCGNKDAMETSLSANHTSHNLFDFLDVDVPPASHGLYGSSPLSQHIGKQNHLHPHHMASPSPMLSINNSAKSGSDLYLPSHEYSHIQPSFPNLSRSPGSDHLEWLDLESSFGSQGPTCAGHGGLTDLQFGEMGTFLDGMPSAVGPARECHQFQPPDLHNDLGFGSLGNSNFVDNSDIFQPATSEQSFIEIGMTH